MTAAGSWSGRTVLITGASSGIGREVARLVAARGARVGLMARSADGLAAVAQELSVDTHVAAADVADPDAVERAVREVQDALGPVEVLVNNAGIGRWGSVLDTPVEDFERLVQVNYLGAVYVTKAVLAGMVERGSGHIVNVASVAGRLAAPYEAAYSASKFAMVGFSEALAAELTGVGVGVSLIKPGPVSDTAYFDARGTPAPAGRPSPVSVDRVAVAVLDAVDTNRSERYLPRWLGAARRAAALVPSAHRAGLRRRFRNSGGDGP